MNITLAPHEALKFIEEANRAGIAHDFVEVPVLPNTVANMSHKLLKWRPDWDGPGLTILLKDDGTWVPVLEEVRSPGVDTIDGYNHGR
jgi:hypothetical protein